jgi:hypothetical protein
MPPRTPLEVSVPSTEPDAPRIGRLALIVVFCFGIGIGWPILAGLDFVQRPPGSVPLKPGDDVDPPPADADPDTKPSPAPGPTPGVTGPVNELPRAAAHLAPMPSLGGAPAALPTMDRQGAARIEAAVVDSCGDGTRSVRGACDTPPLAQGLEGLLSSLGRCRAARGASGLLSLGLELDLAQRRVTGVRGGRSTSLSKETAGALLECARSKLLGSTFDPVQHQHQEYSIYYRLRFGAAGGSQEPAAHTASGPSVVAASGQATIIARGAVVRDSPTQDGKIVQHLQLGARLSVTGRKGDWYRIRADGRGGIGWVQRKALGL